MLGAEFATKGEAQSHGIKVHYLLLNLFCYYPVNFYNWISILILSPFEFHSMLLLSEFHSN